MVIKEHVSAFVTSNFYLADPTALEDGASLPIAHKRGG